MKLENQIATGRAGIDFPGRITVLIVEDSPLVRERLVSLVEDVPNTAVVGTAAEGHHAAALFQHYRPDAVVLDLSLPGLNGIQLLNRFKCEHPRSVVMILTTYAFDEFRRRCVAAGADHFFNKVTEFERVTEVLVAMTARDTAKGKS